MTRTRLAYSLVVGALLAVGALLTYSPEGRFIAGFHTPISFYGRVVDQHGEPVAQAAVRITAHDNAFSDQPSKYTRQADEQGFFSIKSIVGLSLFVAVSKPGYLDIPQTNLEKVASSGLFPYGYEMNNDPNRRDKNAPVVFILYKLGPVEPLVKVGEKSFRVERDGTPQTVSLDNQGGHQVVLRCWNTDRQRPPGQRTYDWRLEITVPDGGGLAVREDAFAFQAPEEGYLPADTLGMSASLPYAQWDSVAERSYFLRFGDNTSARVNLRTNGGGHFVTWESFFNPKAGSRNLESDPAKEATP